MTADDDTMALLGRYRVALAIVAAALTTTAGVFAFARPEYDSERGSEMIDIADLTVAAKRPC